MSRTGGGVGGVREEVQICQREGVCEEVQIRLGHREGVREEVHMRLGQRGGVREDTPRT